MKPTVRSLISAVGLSLACMTAMATSTKDIVLDRVTAAPGAASAATTDAMAVSVLIESPDGSLSPKSTNSLFRTGDRFRVKVLASRDAKVSLYNTNPRGETNPTPLWQGEVTFGQDTISPRLALTGSSGVDQLHVVLEPRQEPGVLAWLGNWLRSFKDGPGAAKDIRLDVQNTPTATYMVNGSGQGLVSTVQIVHTR
jgi:hypothetical protein